MDFVNEREIKLFIQKEMEYNEAAGGVSLGVDIQMSLGRNR